MLFRFGQNRFWNVILCSRLQMNINQVGILMYEILVCWFLSEQFNNNNNFHNINVTNVCTYSYCILKEMKDVLSNPKGFNSIFLISQFGRPF